MTVTPPREGTGLPPSGESQILFSVDDNDYVLSLPPEREKKFRRAIDPWIKAARFRNELRPWSARPAEIRAWAREQGHEMPERGRLPQRVMDAFYAYHLAGSVPHHDPEDTRPEVIRAWAGEMGFEVPVRGQIPREIVDAYRDSLEVRDDD